MEYGTDLYEQFQGHNNQFKVNSNNHELEKKCDYNQLFDNNYYRYVGWEQTEYPGNPVKTLFSELTLKEVQKKITNLLKGVHPDGRDILVPIESIGNVFSQFLNNEPTNRELGDIYSRFTIENPQEKGFVQSIVERSITVIVNQIRNEYGMIENNKKLSVWTTVLGDFNKHGLNSYSQSQITGAIRAKRPQTMAFNMNY